MKFFTNTFLLTVVFLLATSELYAMYGNAEEKVPLVQAMAALQIDDNAYELFLEAVERLRPKLDAIKIDPFASAPGRAQVKAELIKEKEALLPYLLRPFAQVRLAENGEMLSPDGGSGEDYIYNQLRKAERNLPYRGTYLVGHEKKEQNFYVSGTPPTFFDYSLTPFNNNKNLAIWRRQHIYDIGQAIRNFKNGRKNIRYKKVERPVVVVPTSRDDHVTVTVHFFDLENKKSLVSVFLNSWDNPEYHNHIACLFKSAQTPLVDCSYKLQNDQDDKNCGIYSYNYLLAIMQMFEQPEISSQALAAAKNLAVDASDADALATMKQILQVQIKPFLPMYFDDGGERLSPDAIKAYHLKFRWDISSDWIEKFFK